MEDAVGGGQQGGRAAAGPAGEAAPTAAPAAEERAWTGGYRPTKGWKGAGKGERTVENGGLEPACLYIKTLAGRTYMWPTSDGRQSTMLDIKRWIQDQDGIPPEQQRLVFAGKQLSDDETFESANLETSCTLHLIVRS